VPEGFTALGAARLGSGDATAHPLTIMLRSNSANTPTI
jgi:hypothetical protein